MWSLSSFEWDWQWYLCFMFLGPCESSRNTRNSGLWKLFDPCPNFITKMGKGSTCVGVIRGMELLTRPVNQRFLRPNQQRLAPFIVVEGPHSVGKTCHTEGISLWLTKQGFAVQGLTFPNNQTPLGRFLKRALREQLPLSTLTHHVLFSLHRWEFDPPMWTCWVKTMLSLWRDTHGQGQHTPGHQILQRILIHIWC